MFLSVICLTRLAVILGPSEQGNPEYDSKRLFEKLGDKKSSLVYQFSFLFLIYIEYPLMLFLVVAGLDKMDIYHIVLLFVFVLYTLFPKTVVNNSVYLLVYSLFFILEKYVYSLVGPSDPGNWQIVIGLTSSYDPNETKKYFRYPPRFDQWCLVILAFILYRR